MVKLWMSAEVMADVGEANRLARIEIEEVVNRELAKRSYGEGVSQWAFIAMILNSKGPPYPEVNRFHRKDRSVEFRLKIDHAEFLDSDSLGHRQLICKALLRSLDLLIKKKIPDFDAQALRRDFIEIATKQGWLESPPAA